MRNTLDVRSVRYEPVGVKVELEDAGGFKIPKDIVKSRAERLGLNKKSVSAVDSFAKLLPDEE